MDKWTSRAGKSQRREKKKQEDQRRERVRREDSGARKGRKVVFIIGGQGPDFLRWVAFWSIRASGFLR